MFDASVATQARALLAIAVIVKGLAWPAAPTTISLAFILAGGVALTGRWASMGFAVVAALSWLTLIAEWHYANHLVLMAVLATLAIFVPWSTATAANTVATRLMMVQVSVVYFWAAIWKTNAEFLSGAVLHHEWRQHWMPSPPGLERFAVALALFTVGAELFLAVGLWIRSIVKQAIGLGLLLHAGMIVTIGATWVLTAELITFALLCGSTYPIFLKRGHPGSAVGSTRPRTFA